MVLAIAGVPKAATTPRMTSTISISGRLKPAVRLTDRAARVSVISVSPDDRRKQAVWPLDLDDFRAPKPLFFAPQNATAALGKTQCQRPVGGLSRKRKRQWLPEWSELGDPGQNLGVFTPHSAVLFDVRPANDSLLVDKKI